MTVTVSPIQVVEHEFRFRLLDVLRTEWLTPRMVRVTLGGDALHGFRSDAPDDGMRLFFPPDASDPAWLPTVAGAKLVFPGERPPGREYTPRRFDPLAGELAFDFVVHGDGPASAWAASASPGQPLGFSGPRKSRTVVGNVDWYLLAGDESGLPSIARRLEELPDGTRAIAVIEVEDASEEQPIETRADLELIWLHRATATTDVSDLLANALRAITFPSGEVFAWAAGEASSMRATRRHLFQERDIPETRSRITGYWKRAIANYDHHLPLDG